MKPKTQRIMVIFFLVIMLASIVASLFAGF